LYLQHSTLYLTQIIAAIKQHPNSIGKNTFIYSSLIDILTSSPSIIKLPFN